MRNSPNYIALEDQYGAHNYQPLDVVVAQAKGVWVWDVEGRKYLDCLAAYSAVNQGHCHPRIVATLLEQAQRATLTSRAFRNDQLGPFLRELHLLTGYEMALPMNTGSEAVETAIKLVRKWGYVQKGIPRNGAEIVVADGNFQGRTVTIISFSSQPSYRDFFGPYTPGFVRVPYGDSAALERALTPRTAAVMLEPIQGEAGVVVPPAGYLAAVADICRRNEVLLVADEIQTGLGRTGKLFACEHEQVRPDVMILGKALSGGVYPVSAVLADRAVMELFQPGEHGSTFGGNPLGAAVARTALRVLIEENLIQRSAALGEYFQQQLTAIPSPFIKEIRGKGLMIGVEVAASAGGARHFCEALCQHGVLCNQTHQQVIRLAPPLVIEREEIDWALERLADVFTMR